MDLKRIAVIGTGIMGSGIAANFLKHGHPVTVWNRSKDKYANLLALGATEATSPKEAAAQSDIVFEVTANDESSRSVWVGDSGILSGATKDTVLIASATLSTDWTDELVRLCAKAERILFDMPLTGGRVGAETGQLVLLVGGDKQKLEELKPTLEAISQKVMYFGPAGSGMRFKLLLNMVQAIHISAFGEALRIAKANNMDIKAVGDALAERPGGVSTNIAWRDYQTEPNPINFSVEWITKDLSYAKQLAQDLNLPLLDDVLTQYNKAIELGHAQDDWTKINTL